MATTIGATYNVSFWLGDNSGLVPVDPDINMLGYAQAGLPAGTVPIPEPETYALMLMGIGLVGLAARRRKA